jgi:UDP-N-acetylglucosamine transferase subunit ALG13
VDVRDRYSIVSTSMRVLITVGSTRFDALVKAALSQPVLNALTQKGYSDVVIQCGNSQVEDDAFSPTERERNVRRYGVNIDVWRFKPSLDEEYDAADLVIGHAGLRSPFSLLSLAATCPMTSGIVVQAQEPYSMYCEGANLS